MGTRAVGASTTCSSWVGGVVEGGSTVSSVTSCVVGACIVVGTCVVVGACVVVGVCVVVGAFIVVGA